jgi:hypothetical protein
MVGMRSAHKTLVGEPEGKMSTRKIQVKVENNIRMDLRETGWENVEWMHLAQD